MKTVDAGTLRSNTVEDSEMQNSGRSLENINPLLCTVTLKKCGHMAQVICLSYCCH